MTKAQYERRQRLIAEGRCPRCGREVHAWSLKRPEACSPASWVYCIRRWEDIHAKEQALTVR